MEEFFFWFLERLLWVGFEGFFVFGGIVGAVFCLFFF